jgi:adenine-specific DNA-methyltransferase
LGLEVSTAIQAKAETARAVITFGQANCPIDIAWVQGAIAEAISLVPKPKFLIFVAYEFEPLAATLIHELGSVEGIILLQVQMNFDLQTEDLKKKRSSNESFWLIGQPDVRLHDAGKNEIGEKLYRVEVLGFDYYDTKEGKIISGSANHIAVWLLDTDYDGRSLFPRQVFFPMAGDKEGWAKLAKNLRAQVDEELIEAYRGKISLPFTAGQHCRAAVKIVDERGIESVRVVDLSR